MQEQVETPRNGHPDPTPINEPLLSVGRVADRTGISVETLRIWERRYGVPAPRRLPSGHRRYTFSQVAWLRKVAEALARGHRPGEVLKMDEERLDRLIDGAVDPPCEDQRIRAWVELAGELRAPELADAINSSIAGLEPSRACDELLTPFLHEMGRRWASGDLEIRHEHLASQVVEDALRARRLELRADHRRAEQGLVLLATLPEERHGLALRMAELVCTSKSVRIHMLGIDTPVEEILGAANEIGAEAVGLSVSLATGGVKTDGMLVRLRKELPEDVHLIVGGYGARRGRRGPRGIRYFDSYVEFERWLGETDWKTTHQRSIFG